MKKPGWRWEAAVGRLARTGGPVQFVFGAKRFQAILNTAPIEVEERVLPLAGVAVMIPLRMIWRSRRRIEVNR